MRKLTGLTAILVIAAGCGSPSPSPQAKLTQRERDSVIGASVIPGARVVRKALAASDSMAVRSALLDSASQD